MTLTQARYLECIAVDGAEIGRLGRAHPKHPVLTCPDWTGADLLAHLTAFTWWLSAVFTEATTTAGELPAVDPDVAVRDWEATLGALLTLLRDTDPAAPVPNWSVGPQDASWWTRRTAQDVAVHRSDAATLSGASPSAIAVDLALDGIEEYFATFVATALASGAAPRAEATLVLEVIDADRRLVYDLSAPGPVTTLRGTASDLLLGLWHRHNPLELLVDGDQALIATWPRV